MQLMRNDSCWLAERHPVFIGMLSPYVTITTQEKLLSGTVSEMWNGRCKCLSKCSLLSSTNLPCWNFWGFRSNRGRWMVKSFLTPPWLWTAGSLESAATSVFSSSHTCTQITHLASHPPGATDPYTALLSLPSSLNANYRWVLSSCKGHALNLLVLKNPV